MPVTKTISRLLLVTLFTAFLLLPIFVTGIEKAYAADGVWVDAVTIEIAGEKYIDDELGSMEYYLNGERECSSFANGFSDDYWDGGREDTTARYNPRTRNAVSGYCENGENETLNLSRVENSHILAHWIDSGALVMVEGFRVTGIGGEILTSLSSKLSGAVLEKVEGHDNVFALTEGECRSSVTVTSTGSGDTAGQGTLRLRLGEGENNCGEDGGVDIAIRIGSPANAALDPGSGERPSDVADGLDDSCESNGSVLGWIMCPVSNLLDGAVNWLDNTIQGLLIVEEERYENEGLFKAWKQVRNIAYIILIPIMLVMVIGTALGFEVFSAYTIKRALPRMVIAVIFITLSWYICTFLIDFFNVVGTGVLGLITSPFDNIQSGLRGALELAGIVKDGGSADGEAAQGLGLVALVGTAGVVGFATGAVTLGIILSTLFSAALVLLFVFFILVARQMFILLFLLAAPLAILAWIFPGNDKMWKLWWSSFSKLLIMFPLVMAIIGLGRVFATVVGSAASGDNDNQIVTMLIIVAAYIIPFAAIPFTFKWVGGLFGNLAGMVNDKNRGLLDRGKKYRGEERAKGLQAFMTGDGKGRFRQSGIVRRAGLGLSAGAKGGFGFGERGEQAISTLEGVNAQARAKNNPALAQLAMKDDANAVMALSGGTTSGARQAARELFTDEHGVYDEARANRAIAAAQAIGISRANANTALTTLAQNKSRAVRGGGVDVVQAGIQRLAAGNRQLEEDLSYNFQYNSRQAGRVDLGGNWMGGEVRAAGAAAHQAVIDSGGTQQEAVQAGQAAVARATLYDGVTRTETRTLAGAHTASTSFARTVIEQDLESGDRDRLINAGVLLKELHGNLSTATGGNRDEIVQALTNAGIDITGESGVSIDAQIVNRINLTPTTAPVTVAELNNRSRTWGNTPLPERGGPEPPPPAPPTP